VYADKKINNSYSDDEIKALQWIKDSTPKDAVILSFPEKGTLINQVAGRKNVIDTNFMLIQSIDERYSDVERIYTTISVLEAIHLMEKYNADFLYVSKSTIKEKYSLPDINYSGDKCFLPVFENDHIKIYQLRCEVKT
jgi:uncharacterized membrane protein